MENTDNGTVLLDRGFEFLGAGETDKAVVALEEAAEYFDKKGNLAGYTRAINGVGVAYAEAGNEAVAIEYYMRGLARARKEKAVGL